MHSGKLTLSLPTCLAAPSDDERVGAYTCGRSSHRMRRRLPGHAADASAARKPDARMEATALSAVLGGVLPNNPPAALELLPASVRNTTSPRAIASSPSASASPVGASSRNSAGCINAHTGRKPSVEWYDGKSSSASGHGRLVGGTAVMAMPKFAAGRAAADAAMAVPCSAADQAGTHAATPLARSARSSW